MEATTENRYAPPTSNVADVDSANLGLVLASRGRRLAGVLLDGIIIALIAGIISSIIGLEVNPFHAASVSFSQFAMRTAVTVLVFLALQSYLLVTQGQTIGKAILGMRIVGMNGEKVPPFRIIVLRYVVPWLIGIVPFLNFLFWLLDPLLIFRESRQCLHDTIASTIVVKV